MNELLAKLEWKNLPKRVKARLRKRLKSPDRTARDPNRQAVAGLRWNGMDQETRLQHLKLIQTVSKRRNFKLLISTSGRNRARAIRIKTKMSEPMFAIEVQTPFGRKRRSSMVFRGVRRDNGEIYLSLSDWMGRDLVTLVETPGASRVLAIRPDPDKPPITSRYE